jgi:AraC-like DNA-binding protein
MQLERARRSAIGEAVGIEASTVSAKRSPKGRIKAKALRRLTTTPLSQWPEALVECLDTLLTFGVCQPSALVEMLRPVVALSRPDRTGVPAGEASPRATVALPIKTDAKLSPHVRRICLHIRTHYSERILLESLAARVGRNTAYVATLFRRQMGMTIHRYLINIRMQRAAKLLCRREKVEAVMLFVGYRSKKNFYRQFAVTFGVTPGRYRASRVESRSADTRTQPPQVHHR